MKIIFYLQLGVVLFFLFVFGLEIVVNCVGCFTRYGRKLVLKESLERAENWQSKKNDKTYVIASLIIDSCVILFSVFIFDFISLSLFYSNSYMMWATLIMIGLNLIDGILTHIQCTQLFKRYHLFFEVCLYFSSFLTLYEIYFFVIFVQHYFLI